MNQIVDDFLSSPFIFSLMLIIVLIIIILVVYDKKEKMFINVGKICVYTYIGFLGLVFTRDHYSLEAQKKLVTNSNINDFTRNDFVNNKVQFPVMD